MQEDSKIFLGQKNIAFHAISLNEMWYCSFLSIEQEADSLPDTIKIASFLYKKRDINMTCSVLHGWHKAAVCTTQYVLSYKNDY